MDKIGELWKKYEEVRLSGKYNMITEWGKVAKIIGVDKSGYAFILRNYEDLKLKYGNNDTKGDFEYHRVKDEPEKDDTDEDIKKEVKKG